MKADFLVFGSNGLQGSLVVRNLLESGHTVFASDLYAKPHGPPLPRIVEHPFAVLDLRDVEATIALIESSGAEIIVNCAEGDWNLNVYLACLQARRHCVDLGSRIEMTKKQLELHDAFANIGRTAITGCGSAPGIGNVLLRYGACDFDTVKSVEAGFAWDSSIKQFVVPFSIESILEEMTEPAPYIQNGKWRTALPLQSVTAQYHRRIGFQKGFLAHHSETYTYQRYLSDKGVKNIKFFAGFPEHSISVLQTLIQLGFTDRRPVKVRDNDVVPIEFLARLLRRLKRPAGYKESENLWVRLDGTSRGKPKTVVMECLVPTLPEYEPYGCNIDTAIPATIVARMITSKKIRRPGSFSPEEIVPEKPFFAELKKYQMLVYKDGVLIN